jgi:hypothetical protein
MLTEGMHENNEWGTASHSHYKEMTDADESAASNSFERFQEIRSECLLRTFGIINWRGPFELVPMGDKPIVTLDLAFALDPRTGLESAQFWRQNRDRNAREECTAGSPLHTGDCIEITRSRSILQSEQRLALVGTAKAYDAILRQLMKEKGEDPKVLERSGKDAVNAGVKIISNILLTAVSNVLSASKSLQTVIPWDAVNEELGFRTREELYFSAGSRRDASTKIHETMSNAAVGYSFDAEQHQLVMAYNNRDYSNTILAILAKHNILPSSLSLTSFQGTFIMTIGSQMFEVESVSAIAAEIKELKKIPACPIPASNLRESEILFRINKTNDTAIQQALQTLTRSGGYIMSADIPDIGPTPVTARIFAAPPANSGQEIFSVPFNKADFSSVDQKSHELVGLGYRIIRTEIPNSAEKPAAAQIVVRLPSNFRSDKASNIIRALSTINGIKKVSFR